MTLITRDQQLTLDYGFDGAPFVRTVAKTSITTADMNYGLDGAPFVAVEGDAPPPPPDEGLYIMVAVCC